MGKNRTICLCICALLLANSALLAEDNASDSQISFKLYDNYLLVVQGSLGKLKKRNFLIDTGASPTVIDQSIAQQLEMTALTEPSDTTNVVSGSVKTQFALLPSLQLGPIRRQTFRVVIADLGFLHSKVGTRIDAVVGLDVLGESSFRIDYQKKRIVFGPIEMDASAVPFGSNPPLVTVQMMLDDQPMRVLVDTGTAGLILFKNHLGAWEPRLPSGGLMKISDLGGPASLPIVTVTDTRVGRLDMGARNAYLADGHNCCDFDGLMGISARRFKQVAFDFEHKFITWQLQDRAFPTMSEAGPRNCLLASAPGFVPRGSGGAAFDDDSGCPIVPAPRFRSMMEH